MQVLLFSKFFFLYTFIIQLIYIRYLTRYSMAVKAILGNLLNLRFCFSTIEVLQLVLYSIFMFNKEFR